MRFFVYVFLGMMCLSHYVFALTEEEKNRFVDSVKCGDLYIAEKILTDQIGNDSIDPFQNVYSIEESAEVWNKLYSIWPNLKELERFINNDGPWNEVEYRQLIENKSDEIKKILELPFNLETKQALYCGLYDLALIKSRTIFKAKDGAVQENKSDSSKNQDDTDERELDLERDPWGSSSDQASFDNVLFDRILIRSHGVLIETTAPLKSPLMRSEIFDVITGNDFKKITVGRARPYRDTQEIYPYKVHTYGCNNIPLPVPLGYRPVSNSSNVRIFEYYSGEYTVVYEGHEPLLELSLIKQEYNPGFSGKRLLLQVNAQPTGIDQKSWPLDLLSSVEEAMNREPLNPLEQVRFIGSYIKNNYRYYSKELGEETLRLANKRMAAAISEGNPRIVALAKSKVIQYSGAAAILAALTRDFLKIPARVVGGRTSVLRDGQVVIRTGSPSHAWIEVWIEGKGWVSVDPTPFDNYIPQEKKPKKNSYKYEKIQDENAISNIADKNAKELDTSLNKNNDKEENLSFEKGNLLLENIYNEFEERHQYKNKYLQMAFLEELIKIYSHVGDPKGKISDINKLIKRLEIYGENYPLYDQYLMAIKKYLNREFIHLQDLTNLNHLDFQNLIQEEISKDHLHEAYHLIRLLEEDLKQLEKVRSLSKEESEYRKFISNILLDLRKIKHPDTGAYEVVDRLYKNLSGPITKKILKEKYGNGLRTLGNKNNIKLANDLCANKLDNLVSMVNVSKYIKLLLQKTYIPEYDILYFGKITKQKQPIKMYYPAQDFTDFTNAILPVRPFNQLLEEYVNGRIMMHGYRKPIKVARPSLSRQEILTMILVDKSSSMKGDRTRFATSLISSFMDRARGENSDKVKHNVIVVPFTENVLPPQVIKSDDDAIDYIDKKILEESPSDVGGSTDIEKVILHAYDSIAKSLSESLKDKKSKIDLRKANIWLITDGEASINEKNLEDAMKKIPENVKINFNVFLIGEKENDLDIFFRRHPSNFMKKVRLSDQDIKLLINPRIDAPDDIDQFATSQTRLQLDPDLLSRLRQIKSMGLKIEILNKQKTKEDNFYDSQIYSFFHGLDYDRDPLKKVNLHLRVALEYLFLNKESLKSENIFKSSLLRVLIGIKHLENTKQIDTVNYKRIKELMDY